MWKRDEAVRPAAPPPPASLPLSAGARSDARASMEKDIVNIGKSVVIKGELTGSEDLTIEGQVEGTIQLREHVLTIGPNARIKAQVFAKSVVVLGQVTGNVTASDKVDIRDNGSVDGDIISPRVAIAEGAHFRGSVDMQRKGGVTTQAAPAAPPAAQSAQASSPGKPAAQAPPEKPAIPAAAQPSAATPASHRVGA
ncbi:MAG: polymer-forming cytoskeletal protein [Acidobacteriota bacterium]